VLLLSGTAWVLLLAVAVWLALAWSVARADREPLATGLLLAGLLAFGALVFGLGSGLGLDVTLRRTLRAGLLVLVATWLRAAAGAEGLREVFRRALGRLRGLPSLPEAISVLDGIAAEGRLLGAGRALVARLADVPLRPLPLLDAVLVWTVGHATYYRPLPPGPPPRLALRAVDAALLVSALVPAAALVAQ
jgi:NAD(P)-dependent dehydrogenase (short-subunit alcohol dehydrogenase family)